MIRVLVAALVLVFGLGVSPLQSSAAQNPPQKKAKKIWTNDDLDHGGLGSRWTPGGGPPPATVIPGASEPNADIKEKEKPVKKEKDPKPFREKLVPLRAQLEQLDAQVKDLRDKVKNPIAGSNAIDLQHASVVMRPGDLLKELEQKRQEIQQKISDLEDEARRNGFSLGDIR